MSAKKSLNNNLIFKLDNLYEEGHIMIIHRMRVTMAVKIYLLISLFSSVILIGSLDHTKGHKYQTYYMHLIKH